MVFRAARTTVIPMVARRARERNILASVISATTQPLGGETYGGMLLSIPHEQMAEARAFLGSIANLTAEEVSDHV